MDLEEIMAAPEVEHFLIPSSIHLPKVDDAEILEEFTYMFNTATNEWIHGSSKTKIGLIMFIESARSLIELSKICEKAMKLKEKSALIPEALVFGRYSKHVFYAEKF